MPYHGTIKDCSSRLVAILHVMAKSKTLRKKRRQALVLMVLGVAVISGGFVLPLAVIDNYRGIDISWGYGGVEFTYEGQLYGVYPTKEDARAAIDALMDADPDVPPDMGDAGYPVGTTIAHRGIIITKNEDLAWEFVYDGSSYYATTSERAKSMIDDLDSGLVRPKPEPRDDDPDPVFSGYRYTAWFIGVALTLFGSVLWSAQELQYRKEYG